MASSKLFGTYRIGSVDFPVPTTSWGEQAIGTGLDDFPINNSYRIHIWQLGDLPGDIAEQLFAAYDTQQTNRVGPSVLETDPYDGTGADLDYGTEEYSDVRIQSINPRTRGLPNYSNMQVTFEVLVS